MLPAAPLLARPPSPRPRTLPARFWLSASRRLCCRRGRSQPRARIAASECLRAAGGPRGRGLERGAGGALRTGGAIVSRRSPAACPNGKSPPEPGWSRRRGRPLPLAPEFTIPCAQEERLQLCCERPGRVFNLPPAYLGCLDREV